MLIKHPHDFRRVHCGAAAYRYYNIRSEACHHFCAFFCDIQCRIGLDLGKNRIAYSDFVQLVGYGLCIAVAIQKAVGNYKCPFARIYRLKLIKRFGQAAPFNINLFGRAEPKHIFSPLGNGFNIKQVLYSHIFGNRVSAPRAAAEGEGGGELKVINVSNAAEGRRRVDEYAAGFHSACKFGKLFFFGNRV